MASALQRCRPLLRAPSQAGRQSSRSRVHATRPFSSTIVAGKDKSKRSQANEPKAAAPQDDPSDSAKSNTGNSGVFSTNYFKSKAELSGLPRFLKDKFETKQKAKAAANDDGEDGEEQVEEIEDEEEEDDEDDAGNKDNPEEDLEVIMSGDILPQQRNLVNQMRRRGEVAPAGRTEPPPKPEYTWNEQVKDYLDEEGYPRLENGDSWAMKDRMLSMKDVDEIEMEGEEEEDDPDEDGFFAMDEEKDEPGDDPEWENDDITSMAHGELEEMRELRELYRIMAWDMPLLYNHRKDYKPPTASQVLRFRYVTYLGESHPAARKVVCDFTPSALPGLSSSQTTKLIKLLGARYNPDKDQAKISCEMFPTAAQNKRWIGDTLEKLMKEAKNKKDMFSDLPLDLRHHRPKPRIEFPEQWKLTADRKAYLEAKRAAQVPALEDGEQAQQLSMPEAAEQKVPVMAGGQVRHAL